MQLTKKLEAEIQEKYLAYWDAYLKGDMKTFASFLSDDLSVYGTAEGEVFKNKKQVVAFYTATADQLTGQADFRNRRISLKAIGNTIIVNEQCDLYVLAGKEWMFYGHVRLTAIFEQKGGIWKLVHQHGSFPDSRTEDGEQIATNKVMAENLKLKEAVKRRTTELQAKNKELQIESALERVRTVAMGMKKADDMLDICKSISQQLAKLGVKEIRNVQTAIFYPQRGTYMNYEYYAKHNKTFITDVEYKNHKIQVAFARKMMKGANEKVVEHLKGEQLKDWYNYQKTTNQFADKYILTAHSLNYYWYSLGPVALGISTYAPLNNDELDLFQRFMKVFELAYRRYLDIEQAAAQAREAQIEAALERIRARALAMHSSDELTDVAKVLREQMGALGQRELETSAVHLYDEDAEYILSWRAFRLSSDLEGKITYGFFKIPKDSCKIAREFMQKFKSKAADYTIEISGARQTEWYKILFKLAPEVQAAMKKSGTTKEKRYYHFSKFSGGSLLMVSSQEPSNDAIELQKRAAQVFDLAYRRFKDLQKAEAQAREAQVEAALERIRAASLAMQDSSALGEIIYKLYGELTKLDAKLDRCFIMIVNPYNKGITWWMAGHEGLLAENGFFVQMNQHPSHLMYLDYCRKRKKKWTYLFEGKEKRDWDRFGFSKTELAKLPEPIKAFMAAAKKVHLSGSSDQFGSLVTGSFEPLPEEQQEIISRFAIAFNQAYIRFLDLQRAEAQAREAQVEAALERVRSRSMAMHKSEELSDLSLELVKQVQALGVATWFCAFNIYDDDANSSIEWGSNGQGVFSKYRTPREGVFLQYYKAGKRGETLHVHEIPEDKCAAHYEYLCTLPGVGDQLLQMKAAGIPFPKYQIDHVAFFKQGYLLFITYEPVPEAHDIFKRFARVFEQSYTRFLDLKNAEAQAREAEIQLALERVRARTMAMQHSSELNETASVFFQQFQSLHISQVTCAIMLIDETAHMQRGWTVRPDGTQLTSFFDFPLTGDHVLNSRFEAWQQQVPLYHEVLEGERNKEHHRFLASIAPQNFSTEIIRHLPARLIFYSANFSKGYVLVLATEKLTGEEENVLVRLSAVFDQAYTRFLDLQKAEAQAKEAEIQLALERVRARSLAMHHTDELQEVVNVVAQQLLQMGIDMDGGIFIAINNEVKNDLPFWAAAGATDYVQKVAIPYFNRPIYTQLCNAIKKRDPFITEYYTKAEKNEFLKHMFRHHPWNQNSAERKAELLARDGGYARSVAVNQHTTIGITNHHGKKFSDADNAILRRFGAVLEQSYTRFLDLQKAEEQAREAQIQLGLERVRARTMAMQAQGDLFDVVNAFGEQLVSLGLQVDYVSFIDGIISKDRDWDLWGCNPNLKLPAEKNLIPYKEIAYFTRTAENVAIYERTGNPIQVKIFTKEEKDEFLDHYFSYGAPMPGDFKTYLYDAPGEIIVDAFLSEVTVSLCKFNLVPYTPEELGIFKRFSVEFRQAYIRFLDLQKAEAQAKEAKIEAALERVRSRSLAMHHSSELSAVVDTLLSEFTNLEFALTFCIINLIDEQDRSNTVWAANPETGKAPESYYMKFEDYPFHHAMWDAWKAQKKNFIYTIEREEKKIYDEYLYTKTEFRRFPKHVQEANKALKRYVAGFTFFKYSGLQTVSENHITNEDLNILERFGRVFEQCYTRFLDLQKAEAQAREAQIEASLEKVRSRSMAMQQPEELVEVAELLRKEMGQLGVEELETSSIYIVEKETKRAECWYAIKDVREEDTRLVSDEMPLALTNTWVGKQMWKFYQSGEERTSILMKGERRREWINYCAQHSKVLQGYYGDEIPDRTYHLVKFSGGYIGAAAPGDISAESWDLLKRVSTVFSLAYTRFKDLQDAAARAREAQIELALERVRSRSMAMHNSEELKEVIRLVLDQFIHLNINAEHAGFYIDYKAHDDMHIWLADPNIEPYFAVLPYFDTPTWNSFLESKAKGIAFHTDLLDFKEKNKFYKSLFRLFEIPEEAKQFYLKCKGLAVSTVLLDSVGLYIENFQGIPYTEEENKILMRFGKVFQQTYTRFLDLQKAEAQAREAQVEAALENIRSRSLAMHNSSELKEVVQRLFEKFKELGFFHNNSVMIVLPKNGFDDVIHWTYNEGFENSEYHVPFIDHPVGHGVSKAWKNGEKTFEITIDKAEKNRFCDQLFAKTDYARVPDAFKEYLYSTEGYSLFLVFEKHCALLVDTFTTVTYTEYQKGIVRRFANVFEQAYIRFLDLQKAEAQAREAEIQLALERVRARAMAMQKSDELAEAATILFQQVKALGIETYTSGFTIWDNDDNDLVSWMCNADGSVNPPFRMPALQNEWHKQQYESWRRGDEFIVHDFAGEEMQEHYAYLRSFPLLDKAFKKSEAAGVLTPERQVHHAFNFTQGNLLFITLQQVPEAHYIFKRFASTFEQTYTRFLDLQKAEAQAREAQVEAALERVRSRTMGMQKSTELNEVAFVLFEQIRLLGGKLWGTGFALCNAQDAHDEFWFANEMGVMPPVSIPNTEDDVHVAMLQGWKEHMDYLSSQKEGEALAAHYRYLYSLPQMKAFFDPMLEAGFEFPNWQQWHAAYFSKGYLLIITTEPYAEPDIFIRFAKVFDQTYTRFLDLQRVEAQAREARIEAALEKVRSRTMAMQKSGDLNSAAADMFKEIQALGMQPWGCGFNIFDSDEKAVTQYMSLADGGISPPFRTPLTEDPFFIEIYNARQRKDELLVMESAGESLAETYRYMFGLPGSGEIFGDLENAGFEMPKYQITHCAYFSQGYLVFITYQQVTEAHDIFKRFAKVFDQTYTRFLDLQKAEAQAREAQIEAALERVRAKAMAMHTSQELSDVVHELRMQMSRLGQKDLDTCVIHLHDESPDFIAAWAAMKTPESEEGNLEATAQVPKKGLLIIEEALQAYATNKGEYVIVNEGEKISQWMTFLQQVSPAAFEKLQESIEHLPQKDVRSYWSFADFSGGALLIVTTDPPIEETRQLLRRFSNVFGLAYRRFSDIKHAEAQAREAQIEAALERVRSRSMAMHDSKELGEVAKVMFNQMKLLGGELFAFGIVLCDKEESVVQQWHGLGEGDMMTPFQVPVDLDYIHRYRYDQWKAGVELFSIEIPSDYIARHFELMFALPSVKLVMDDLKSKGIELAHPSWEIDYGASFRYGYLLVSSLQPYAEEKIFPRFAKVFEQAYTRFLDLQKAEAQAREAQIEAALERVRSKAMAMHNSSDLPSTAIIAFSELKKLGFVPIRGGISIQNKENRKNLLYSATSSAEGDNLSLVGWAMLDNHPVLAEIYNQWMKGEDYFPELRGDLLKTYYEQVRTSFAVPVEQTEVEQFGYFMYFTHGVFYGWCASPVLDEEKKLLRRFAAVIDLTFKRYFDLQKSEAQAREAQIEAALEKVRSRTLAMQKSDELAGTAAVLFQQLISLGIEPNRLYIILIKDNTADMEAWVTDEDGSKVSMGFTGSYQKNGTLLKMYEGWRAKRKTLVIDMQGEELQQYFHYLHDELNVPFKGGMEQKRRVQHIAYFSHGLIGMASPEEQPIETLELLERFAYVFNLTFTRFNDLQVAEAHALQAEQDLIAIKEAKQKAEQALTELQATQKQLIQSEKMASLGELTAGIAHEIQNPLNFVNNFSEVSKELLEEMREAIEKGDNAEAREIMEDVIRNLEKINHHGKRADGIVKGMLQHSRSSSGQKEKTDINDLCDEYLRLAYHGLRAKDKSFNAQFETKLDPEIGWVEIVPQEIGRVILNLISNAFYAVNERRKSGGSGYAPTVTVVTTKKQDKIEIKVTDNGTGIPESVKEKIFQPFFTTKPTGQGTGLGLSLSYDIVKAHGGELAVETKEGVGTAFIVQLPAV